jgi:hypothetical protein
MQSSEIKEIVNDITSSTVKNKEQHFATIYADFKAKYPLLYEHACKGKLDPKTLDFMLQMLNSINNKEKTQFDASAAVGQMLFSKYVEPKLKHDQDDTSGTT